jgi:hypothetical protein
MRDNRGEGDNRLGRERLRNHFLIRSSQKNESYEFCYSSPSQQGLHAVEKQEHGKGKGLTRLVSRRWADPHVLCMCIVYRVLCAYVNEREREQTIGECVRPDGAWVREESPFPINETSQPFCGVCNTSRRR